MPCVVKEAAELPLLQPPLVRETTGGAVPRAGPRTLALATSPSETRSFFASLRAVRVTSLRAVRVTSLRAVRVTNLPADVLLCMLVKDISLALPRSRCLQAPRHSMTGIPRRPVSRVVSTAFCILTSCHSACRDPKEACYCNSIVRRLERNDSAPRMAPRQLPT